MSARAVVPSSTRGWRHESPTTPCRARELEVLRTGPLATVQDLGRAGQARLGVGVSGAMDRASLRLANRLVGNDDGTAAIEITMGGLRLCAHGGCYVALTGAPCPLNIDGRDVDCNAPAYLADGAGLCVLAPSVGVRSYLAVRGGIDVAPVLGSRSTDVMAGIGPAPLVTGDRLPVGASPRRQPCVDLAPVAEPPAGEIELRAVRGPRCDWFTAEAPSTLFRATYRVTNDSDRVGMRLAGPTLARAKDEELPSEGMVRGALQVPPTGQPTLLLSDHPLTGGYPVIAVVVDRDVDKAAQARPGQTVTFRSAD